MIYHFVLSMLMCTSALSTWIGDAPCSSRDKNTSHTYNGVFDSFHSEGAMGFFSMSLAKDGSFANYTARLDLSQFKTSCDLSLGLMFILHSYWFDEDIASGSNDKCLLGKIGGHYDPFLACGEWSTNRKIYPKCSALNRISPTYKYHCNPSSYFIDGLHHMCEVGDLSGKFGMLFPSEGDAIFDRTFSFDPVAPILANYNAEETDMISAAWSSVALHCSTGEPILCASLKPAQCH